MTDTPNTSNGSPKTADEARAAQLIDLPPIVPHYERKYWELLDVAELRIIGDPIVRLAYVIGGSGGDWYGSRLATAGACESTAKAVTEAAHRLGYHANRVESPDKGHKYVHLPINEDEIQTPGHDPLILDPTYAQFMNIFTPDPVTGLLPDLLHFRGSESGLRIDVGLTKGHHTPPSPYFIGKVSQLRDPNSGVNPAVLSPWRDPQIMP